MSFTFISSFRDIESPEPTVQSIWNDAHLHDEAFERLADGGLWKLASRPSPFTPASEFAIYRVALYKALPREACGRIPIEGSWEDKNLKWQLVGYIE